MVPKAWIKTGWYHGMEIAGLADGWNDGNFKTLHCFAQYSRFTVSFKYHTKGHGHRLRSD